MPIAWHPKKWWNFGLSEDIELRKKKKQMEPIFNGGL